MKYLQSYSKFVVTLFMGCKQTQRQLALWVLRSCICYSGKLIAGHQASYKVASVTLRTLCDFELEY